MTLVDPVSPTALARLGIAPREEWFFGVSIASALAFLCFGNAIFAAISSPWVLVVVSAWLFIAVLGSALSAVRHADYLAERLGEPYGTLILTLSVTLIEVMGISAVMTHGGPNPTLVRDTLFAVIMIILNGMVGLSLLFGAWRYREQHFNLQGANAYLSVVIPLATLTLILPDFTMTTTPARSRSRRETVLALMALGLYVVFLTLQTGRHRGYFRDEADPQMVENAPPEHEGRRHRRRAGDPPVIVAVVLLLAYLAPVIFLIDQMARPVDYVVETLHEPAPLGGLVIALLVATPEAIGAVRAASANHLQRSINIFLGSVLSTIGLTVPAMLVISHVIGHPLVLGLEHSDLVMLVLTMTVAIITFMSGRTNVLQGAVHLLLFIAYFLLILED